jgi:hypothetical protein
VGALVVLQLVEEAEQDLASLIDRLLDAVASA